MTVGPRFEEPITIHNVSFSNRLLRSSALAKRSGSTSAARIP